MLGPLGVVIHIVAICCIGNMIDMGNSEMGKTVGILLV